MADLVLVHSSDPAALLAAVAAPFCVAGRPTGALPLVAVRQGGVRDALYDRAARAGCAGWLGAPVVVFHEVPGVLAGPMAPLTAFERRALLVRAAGAAPGRALAAGGNGRGQPARGVLRALDALVGDFVAERVAPAAVVASLATLGAVESPGGDDDAWARLRDADVAAVYAAYVEMLGALPALGGLRRIDGRDAVVCAAEAVAAEPDRVRERLRVPFGVPDVARTVCLHGLNDLRRGWAALVRALHAAPFVDELRVSLLTDDVHAAAARHAALDGVPGDGVAAHDAGCTDAGRDDAEPTGEDALAHALVACGPARIVRAAPDPDGAARPDALAHVQRTLLGAGPGDTLSGELGGTLGAPGRIAAPPPGDAPAAVRALAAPDVAREADLVARRVKRLLVEGDGHGPVAPHRVLIVSRKARPYGERIVDALRRYGVPVTARLRVALPRVGAVAALLRLADAVAAGWSPATVGALATSPYFATGLDAAALAAVARGRGWPAGRAVPLAEWSAAIGAMCDEIDEGDDRVPAALGGARAEGLREAWTAFCAAVGDAAEPRTRGAWIDRTLGWLGRDAGGARRGGAREGVFGLCRIACRAPHRDPQAFAADALAVDAVRRDVEGLAALGDALAAWRAGLALGTGGGATAAAADALSEVLTAAAWRDEFADALADEVLALTTPHRRGVQVAEASAAVWRTCDHLFVVGMDAGSFPADAGPEGAVLFAAHERRALARAGLPVDAPEAWNAREASLWRTLAAGATRSLHLSYAAGDAQGRTRLPAAYFDDVVGRLAGPDVAAPDAWVERVPASAFAPADVDDAWCAADLHLVAAARAAAESEEARAQSRRVLAHLAADAGEHALVAHVLAAAERERARAALRLERPALSRDAVRAWNGAVTSADLRAWLASRFGDRVWSATELERYGRCAWDFFARDVLGVREPNAPADDDADGGASALDARARGTLVHRVLEVLHRGLVHTHGDAALSTAALRQAERLVPPHVERALDEADAAGQGVPRALRGIVGAELCEAVLAYVAWEVAENEKSARAATPPRRPAAFDIAFGVGDRPPVTLTHGGRTLRLRGRIDRVDEFVEPALRGRTYVVDYKTSAGGLDPVALYEHGGILQLPLYLHAIGRLPEGRAGAWGGAYQIVKDGGKRTAHLHPSTFTKGKVRTGELKGEQEDAGRIHNAIEHAMYHVDGVVAGMFPARIPACSRQCPPHCAVRDACREVRA